MKSACCPKELQVARSSIREARAELCGRGLLVHDRDQFRIAEQLGPEMLRDWIRATTTARGRDKLPLVEEALQLRRLVLPEILGLAIRQAPDAGVRELAERLDDFETSISLVMTPVDIATSHTQLVVTASKLTGNPAFRALGMALAQAFWMLPVWAATREDRKTWRELLGELREFTRERNAEAARLALRQGLRTLDSRTLQWVADPTMPERLAG